MLPGSAPAASKPVATAASIIVEEKKEPEALEKTPTVHTLRTHFIETEDNFVA